MKAQRIAAILLAVLAVAVSGASLAFLAGGHHYTLLAVYQGRPTSANDRYKLLEATCAQLPDLATELDATTQRIRVLEDLEDWAWGFLGRCSSSASRHMVATQYYLHGLTGANAVSVRRAAVAIVGEIDVDIRNEADPQRLANLWCQRGFAAHLFGDTFAHVQLGGSSDLYKTGLGHARDFVKPDYMLQRTNSKIAEEKKNDWRSWAQAVSRDLDARALTPTVERLEQDFLTKVPPANRGDAATLEPGFTAVLATQATSAWLPYKVALEKWSEPPNSKRSFMVTVRCQDQIDRGPVAQGGTGFIDVQGKRPQCAQVWSDYLKRADANFAKFQVAVKQNSALGKGCTPEGDQLKNGE